MADCSICCFLVIILGLEHFYMLLKEYQGQHALTPRVHANVSLTMLTLILAKVMYAIISNYEPFFP